MTATKLSAFALPVFVIAVYSISIGNAQDRGRVEIDYQRAAEGTRWAWEESLASPIWSISQSGGKYDFVLINSHKSRDNYMFSVQLEGKEVYAWKGHSKTVFQVVGDRLYYAEFHPSSSGGNIVAIDLTKGTQLWKTPLKAVGPVAHSAYSNLLNLKANEKVVMVFGNESFGQYFEIKTVNDGKTVGHKLFPKPDDKDDQKVGRVKGD